MIKRLLFGTKFGDWLLSIFEKLTGLALVDIELLEGRTYTIRG